MVIKDTGSEWAYLSIFSLFCRQWVMSFLHRRFSWLPKALPDGLRSNWERWEYLPYFPRGEIRIVYTVKPVWTDLCSFSRCSHIDADFGMICIYSECVRCFFGRPLRKIFWYWKFLYFLDMDNIIQLYYVILVTFSLIKLCTSMLKSLTQNILTGLSFPWILFLWIIPMF